MEAVKSVLTLCGVDLASFQRMNKRQVGGSCFFCSTLTSLLDRAFIDSFVELPLGFPDILPADQHGDGAVDCADDLERTHGCDGQRLSHRRRAQV